MTENIIKIFSRKMMRLVAYSYAIVGEQLLRETAGSLYHSHCYGFEVYDTISDLSDFGFELLFEQLFGLVQ
jgi:hypothetical protein